MKYLIVLVAFLLAGCGPTYNTGAPLVSQSSDNIVTLRTEDTSSFIMSLRKVDGRPTGKFWGEEIALDRDIYVSDGKRILYVQCYNRDKRLSNKSQIKLNLEPNKIYTLTCLPDSSNEYVAYKIVDEKGQDIEFEFHRS